MCRWVGSDRPRVLAGRHAEPCTCGPDDIGCQPCTEPHCLACGRNHAEVTCTGCLATAREDLLAIGNLMGHLSDEAEHRGIESEAMTLAAPVSNPEAWQHRALSAFLGRIPADYLEDCLDESHPAWVMAEWAGIWRDHLGHPVANRNQSYLLEHLTRMAEMSEPSFAVFAAEVHTARLHVEDVLHDGVRDEHGAPCLQCGKPMVRLITDRGAQDVWLCRTCRREVAGDQYRYAVGVAYRAHADRLTATDLADRLGVRASVIRVWGARGQVRKRGRAADGRMLYDVADTEARVARTAALATA